MQVNTTRFGRAAVALTMALFLLTGCEPASPTAVPSSAPGFRGNQPLDRGEDAGAPVQPTPLPTGSGAFAGPPAVPSAAESESERFQRECEAGVNQWTSGQVSYPATIEVSLNNPKIYNVVVDVQDAKLPPDQAIALDEGTARRETVTVQCEIAARLTSAGDDVEITQTSTTAYDGWVLRTFSPLGIAEWSWNIVAATPEDQEVQLELQPAVLQDDRLPGLSEARVASFTSKVEVDASPVERMSYWFETEWPLVLAVVGALATATVAFALWWERYFSRAARAKRRGQSEHLL